MTGYRLLTGATGLLGSYLLRDLLARDCPTVVLARPNRHADAVARIDEVLAQLEEQWGRWLVRPVVMCGDITEPQLGLEPGELNWLRRNCDAVLHSAASLTFHEAGREPWLSNVEGVRNMLSVCHACSIGRFDHVSTAYVCGLRTGRVLEAELDIGQEFGNDYERSKAEAERLLRGDKHLQSLTVFRPSIIVGDSRTGFTTTFHGFYIPLRIAGSLLPLVGVDQALQVNYLGILGLTGKERKNFVPVDWVSNAITTILSRDEAPGGTYALTSEHPVNVTRLHSVFERIVHQHRAGIEHSVDVRRRAGEGGTSGGGTRYIEAFRQKFVEQFAVYRSYWRDDPDFDCSATRAILPDLPCPEITDEMLHRLCQYAVDKNFGFPPYQRPTSSWSSRHWMREHGTHRDLPLAVDGVESPAVSSLALVLAGPGGGSWTVHMHGPTTFSYAEGCCAVRPSGTSRSVARTTATCFQDLVCGRKSLDECLDQGSVIVLGDQDGVRQLQSLVRIGLPGAAGLRIGEEFSAASQGPESDGK